MLQAVINPEDFTADGVVRQDAFLEAIERHDWSSYAGKNILVRGCGSAVIPPWAYMIIMAKLVPYSRTIRFGNEHDSSFFTRLLAEHAYL